MKKILLYCSMCIYSSLIFPCFADELDGVWENNERFVECQNADTPPESTSKSKKLRTVLKPYYRFVYENTGWQPLTVQKSADQKQLYTLTIHYAGTRSPMTTPVWLYKNGIFASFYQKTPFEHTELQKNKAKTGSDNANSPQADILNGFWIEQGLRKGIRIYPQENPDSFDVFFFMNGQYIQFRYWKAYLMYKEQSAVFQLTDENTVKVPKFLRRGTDIYSCITGNGSTLRNYVKGSYTVQNKNGEQSLTLHPDGGGPGSHAAGNIYPHEHYTALHDIPLFIDEQDGAFALGKPFLTRSAVTNLDDEIIQHNNLRRPPPEPLLQADQLNFYWERIQIIRSSGTAE